MARIIISGLKYRQFAHEILFTEMSMKELAAFASIDPYVQRELDVTKRQEIRTFILRSLERGEPLYFSPFIFSARGGVIADGENFSIDSNCKLYISDGQHRYKAMEVALLTLRLTLTNMMNSKGNEHKIRQLEEQIEYLENYKISMQIYLALDTKAERQLFTDLNTERREAQPGQMLQYDHRDLYSVLTRQIANELHDDMEIEMVASRLVRTSAALTTLVTMKRCLVALFEGTLAPLANEPDVAHHNETIQQIGLAFFKQWLVIFPKNAANRRQYVSGLSGIQIALALMVNRLVKTKGLSYSEAITALGYLKKCTWKQTDTAFDFMYKEEKKRLVGHSSSSSIKRTATLFYEMIEQEMVVKA